MNGQQVFEKLSEMSEESRKQCYFWWLSSKEMAASMVDVIAFDNKDFVDETSLDEAVNSITADDIALIYKEIEDEEMSDSAVYGYWEEYSTLLMNKLKELIDGKLRKKGLKMLED